MIDIFISNGYIDTEQFDDCDHSVIYPERDFAGIALHTYMEMIYKEFDQKDNGVVVTTSDIVFNTLRLMITKSKIRHSNVKITFVDDDVMSIVPIDKCGTTLRWPIGLCDTNIYIEAEIATLKTHKCAKENK